MEIFKQIPELDNLYSVSNFGRVKRLSRYKDNNGGKVYLKEIILKQNKSKKGYLYVSLSLNSKKRTLSVHRLVALAFIENPENYIQVNHIDECKTNNNVYNLEWCSNRQNITHSKKNISSTSKFVGVHFNKRDRVFVSQIHISGNTYHLGSFKNEIDAYNAYVKYLNNWEKYNIKPL